MKPVPPAARAAVLERCRTAKMTRSVHAYVRGSTKEFYEWLSQEPSKRLPSGPDIWICGDCHAGNLGPISGAGDEVEIAIRDFDQTVIGNPAHDLVRLALSLATAARSSDLPGVTLTHILEAMMLGYERGLRQPRRHSEHHVAGAEPVRLVLRQALKRKWRDLANERIEDTSPTIPLGKRFWPLRKEERAEIEKLFGTARIRELVNCLQARHKVDGIEVVDAAYWRKGCSSLGRLRYAVLVLVGGKRRGHFCLMDIKEACAPAAPHAKRVRMPLNPGARVIEGARHLSPPLGDRMMAIEFSGRPVFVRELRPQDLKVELDKVSPPEAVATAAFLTEVLGKAHGQQLTRPDRARWLRELKRAGTRKLDAPSWLWSSVVELAAVHEQAYLQFCLRYARSHRSDPSERKSSGRKG